MGSPELGQCLSPQSYHMLFSVCLKMYRVREIPTWSREGNTHLRTRDQLAQGENVICAINTGARRTSVSFPYNENWVLAVGERSL